MHLTDTIAALASAAGGAVRGIVRVSGSEAVTICSRDFTSRGPDLQSLCEPTAVPGEMRLASLYSPLPVLLYCWPDSRSYTRQPMVEIHAPGSPPLLQQLLEHVLAGGARLAEPGEFTLRAFLAGRLDLTQAEAVLGLIDARHQRQFEAALAQMAGGLAAPLRRLRENLLELLAHLEAGLDFATEDIQFITAEELGQRLQVAGAQVSQLAEQMQRRQQADELPRVVLYGWPNVGKSSLLNALAQEQHALVSPQAGTTRDYLTAELTISGQTFQLVDTAGIETLIESGLVDAGQQMREAQQTTAHLHVLCLDSTRPLNDWEQNELQKSAETPRLLVLTKADRAAASPLALPEAICTSAATGEGLDQLRERIVKCLTGEIQLTAVAATAARCRDSLRSAAEALSRARELAIADGYEELVAAEVRCALHEIGQVVGAVYTEDLLDRIFSRFCIGK